MTRGAVDVISSLVKAERVADLNREYAAIRDERAAGNNTERELVEFARRQSQISDALRALGAWPPKVPL